MKREDYKLKHIKMTQREIDDALHTVASVEFKDSAVVIGVMRANGQVAVTNIGSERGRTAIWQAISQNNAKAGRVLFGERRGA